MSALGVRIVCGAIIFGALGALFTGVQARFSSVNVWDDAYMFVRYADNLLAGDGIAWNRESGPAYGLTSLAFLAVVAPVRAALPDAPALAALASSAVCGAAFLAAVAALALLVSRGMGSARWVLFASVFAVLAYAAESATYHYTSGMDTAFAMAYMALFSCAVLCAERAAQFRVRHAVALGILAGAGVAVRPDTCLLTLGTVCGLALFSRAARPQYVLSVVVALGVVLAHALAASLYFGSPAPLAFYAKSLSLYSEAVYDRYRWVAAKEMWWFLASYPVLAVTVIVASARCLRRDGGSDMALLRATLLATAAFLGYHLLLVLPIMAFHGRFYYPALPGLLLCFLLVARACLPQGDACLPSSRKVLGGPRVCLGALLTAVALCSSAAWARQLARMEVAKSQGRYVLTAEEAYLATLRNYWFDLVAVSALPDDLVIATSEVGLPAALNPEKTIIDLAALNETRFAREGFSAAWLFEQYHPDWIYLPHPDYTNIVEAIRQAPEFGRYEAFEAKALGCRSFGVAISRDSKHYAAMRAIIDAKINSARKD